MLWLCNSILSLKKLSNVTGSVLLKYRNVNKAIASLFISSIGRIDNFLNSGAVWSLNYNPKMFTLCFCIIAVRQSIHRNIFPRCSLSPSTYVLSFFFSHLPHIYFILSTIFVAVPPPSLSQCAAPTALGSEYQLKFQK